MLVSYRSIYTMSRYSAYTPAQSGKTTTLWVLLSRAVCVAVLTDHWFVLVVDSESLSAG